MSKSEEPAKPTSRARRILNYPARVAKHLYSLPNFASNISRKTQSLHQEIELLASDAKELKKYSMAHGDLAEENSHRLNRLDERLNDIVHQLAIMNEQYRTNLKPGVKQNIPSSSKELLADEHLLDNFYVEFERWFRGSDAEIKKRQKVYLPYFTETKIDSKKYPVIDIGCGRGEFVQLLGQHGVRAIGLDLNKTMVEHVKAKKLEAVQDDALSYLKKQKTGSLMAITGFHIVEHIPFIDLVRIFDESYRSLARGGFVLFETPNPENLIVGACNFYADPSHLNPLPPAFLEFALKTRGFHKVVVKRLHPVKKDIQHKDPLVKEMAERIYGAQDYAVIAYK